MGARAIIAVAAALFCRPHIVFCVVVPSKGEGEGGYCVTVAVALTNWAAGCGRMRGTAWGRQLSLHRTSSRGVGAVRTFPYLSLSLSLYIYMFIYVYIYIYIYVYMLYIRIYIYIYLYIYRAKNM